MKETARPINFSKNKIKIKIHSDQCKRFDCNYRNKILVAL